MSEIFTFSSLISFAGCLGLGAFYAWLLYQKVNHLSTAVRYTLAGLRIVVVASIAWMLVAPLFKYISYTPEKPLILIAQDNSISVAQVKPKNFDAINYQNKLKSLVERLSSKYEVKTYSFGDGVKPGLIFNGADKLSNGTELIERLKDESVNRNLGAVLIASDGIFNRGGNPLYDLKQLNAPIYTIALGDPVPKKDLLISAINYNDIVYLNNSFILEIEVQAYRAKGESTILEIEENGRKIKSEKLEIRDDQLLKTLQVKIDAIKVGVQRYTVRLSALGNEMTAKNNEQTIFVEVIDGRQKVLLLAGSPHPDLGVIKQAIESQKNYQVTMALPDEMEQLKLGDYSLAILYQLPSTGIASNGLVSRLTTEKLPLWFILGAQSDINAFNQMQSLVKIVRATGSLQEVLPLFNPNFSRFTLGADAAKQVESYDPLYMPFGNFAINGAYESLFDQKIGRVVTQSPLWFFALDNGRKLGYTLGEGIWKWKLEEAKENRGNSLIEEMLTKTVQYLSVKDDKRKFKVSPIKSTFDENEAVVLNATLYNDAYEPVNSPDVNVRIQNQQGKVFNYTFTRAGSGYRLDAGNLPAGTYTFLASTSLGSQHYESKGSFYVSTLITEYQQTTANHQLLHTMAAQNGGKLFMPNEIDDIEASLVNNELVKTINYEDRRYEELINFKLIFWFIVLLMSVEWFFRKRNGEV